MVGSPTLLVSRDFFSPQSCSSLLTNSPLYDPCRHLLPRPLLGMLRQGGGEGDADALAGLEVRGGSIDPYYLSASFYKPRGKGGYLRICRSISIVEF